MRTAETRLPWSYYYQEFEATEEWRRIELPFEFFEQENTAGIGMPTDRLVSLAIVAAKEEMQADIELAEISFYK
jgi:hypothetical protein